MTDGERKSSRRRRQPPASRRSPVDQSGHGGGQGGDGGPRGPRTHSGPAGAAGDDAGAAWLSDDGGAMGDPGTDLVNLGFIGAALRRSKRLWLGLGIAGLFLGLAFSLLRPPTPQAATTLLLTVGPEGQPGTAILTDQTMARSRGVAGIAVRTLHLHESADELLGTYKAVALTDRVLRITVSAPTDGAAVSRADAIAVAFLRFRSQQLEQEQQLQFAALDAALARSEQQLAAIDTRIGRVSAQPTSGAQRAQLAKLQGSRSQAASELSVLRDQVETTKASSEQTTAAMVGQSRVLDTAAPIAQSHLKPLVLFGGAGFVVGLFLGAAIAIVGALVSDRLRRRDDIARALGAPVLLSVPGRPPRLWPRRRALSASADDPGSQRIVAFLGAVLASESHGAALAVVPVDDPRVAASCVMTLAVSLAQRGSHVVVADLCAGAPAARLAGVREPGVHTAHVDGADLDVLVPRPDDLAPVGPLEPPHRPRDTAATTAELAAACTSADVLLCLADLDPSLAGDHLRTWATEAVVVVTAGRSSWTRIHAVGELIRLAGTRIVSAVLVGADRWDESLGVREPVSTRRESAGAGTEEPERMSFTDPTVLRRPGISGASTS